MEYFELEEIKDLQWIEETSFPKNINPRKLLITGTPGSGKSTLLKKLKGWPEEGCLDISSKEWWKSQVLRQLPRELHFGLPFFGHEDSFPVYDTEKLNALSRLELDFFRVPMPPPKKGAMSPDWRSRFAIEFQILPEEKVFEHRKNRAKQGTHHVDKDLTLERVEEEVRVYRSLALLFHRSGWTVYIRDDYNGVPKRFKEEVPQEPDVEELYAELVRKRELYEHLDRLKMRQQILSRTWSHQGNKELLNFFTELLPEVMDVERCSIFIHDTVHDKVWLQSGTGLKEKQIEVPKTGSLVGEVITSGTPLIRNDLHLEEGMHKKVDSKTGFVTRNILCVPINSITNPGVTGAIQVLNKRNDGTFHDQDIKLLERVAYHLELAIENIYLSQEMMDFSALLTHQISKGNLTLAGWAIGLWVLTAVLAGMGGAWLLLQMIP